jgi:hypothetical protein
VKRRIYRLVVATGIVSLIVGAALVPAASSKTPKAHKQKPVAVTCRTSVSTQVPAGQTEVIPPESQGTNYGTADCPKLLGSGMEVDQFTVPDTGDTVGSFTYYFDTGTIHGTFDLTPQEGSLGSTGTGFAETDYTGVVTVTRGSGIFAHYKGSGTSVCVSPDGVHMTCTEKLKITLPASASSKKSG